MHRALTHILGVALLAAPSYAQAGQDPLERAAEAYARMLSGKAQFRVVLTM